MKNIVLVTSIAPKGLENQKRALDTWMKAGFQIISCNIKEEICLIEDEFPQIEFVEVRRDGREIMGKPCPYIYDMLQVVKERNVDICGIVNSDIYLYKFSDEIYEYIEKEACKKVLFIRRNDINDLCDIENFEFELFFGGIDIFFFPKSSIDLLEDDGLLIGQAMWDYWLPIMFNENGLDIKEIFNPVAFHIRHAMRWSDTLTADISWEICKKHFSAVEKDKAVHFLKDKFFKLMSRLELGVCVTKEVYANRSVCCVCNRNDKQVMEKYLSAQTHKNCVISETTKDKKDFDYIIRLPYGVNLSSAFIDNIIWSMEEYRLSYMSVMPYVRGNRTGTLNVGNCCNAVLKRLKNELEDICVWRKTEETKLSSIENVSTSCICSVYMEENEKVIWEKDKFSGETMIYPAGYMAREWVRRYRNIAVEIEIIGFIDNSKNMQNTIIEGIPVFSPDIVYQTELYDKIIIVSNIYQEEIYDKLKEYVPVEKLVVWNEFTSDKLRKTRELLC